MKIYQLYEIFRILRLSWFRRKENFNHFLNPKFLYNWEKLTDFLMEKIRLWRSLSLKTEVSPKCKLFGFRRKKRNGHFFVKYFFHKQKAFD